MFEFIILLKKYYLSFIYIKSNFFNQKITQDRMIG
jgi:hypothetical protein